MQEYNDNIIVYPPNKVLERTFNYSEVPTVHKSLMFIDFDPLRDNAILGSSNINGTLWEGTTFFFRSKQDLEDLKWSGYYVGPTVSDAKFLDHDQIVLAEETGDVQILNIDSKSRIEPYLFHRHFSRVPQVAVLSKSSKFITCSEKTIMLVDTSSSIKLFFPDYHTELIYSIDSSKGNGNCFVSCGADRKVLIWDRRDNNPASVLYTNEFAALTSVAWNPSNDDYIVCGTEGGAVYLVDKREPNSFLDVHHCFENRIHRLSFNPNSSQLAVCGDTNEVIVFNMEVGGLSKVYKNKEQKGMVRGLCWNKDVLYSCGFGTKVCKHII
ncbi:methylosome protein 50-like [Coccinella septempunctata]|uniref:methylosome protein 50-like n=1 Tax=Coccinella septempunctata TaxID=41139 RepID=UPI001D095A05|nr:methylosome protein 50-like [Coccinella septempunctata]